jgi:hypothetical protein
MKPVTPNLVLISDLMTPHMHQECRTAFISHVRFSEEAKADWQADVKLIVRTQREAPDTGFLCGQIQR